MTREEMLKAVRKLSSEPSNEEEDTDLLNRLRAAVPHSKIGDLIFWDPRELTPEQIVEVALRREAEHAAEAAQERSNGYS